MPALPTFFVGPWELSSATAILPERPEAGRILLVESTGKGAALPYHRHKLVLVLSALRHFRDELRARGFEVDHRVASTYAQGILDHVAAAAPSDVIVQQPAEWGIARSILALADLPQESVRGSGTVRGPLDAAPRTTLAVLPDRRFLTSRADFAAWSDGRKLYRMEDFYRWQRKRLGTLLDREGNPLGGRWNFDPENRLGAKALQRHGTPPAPKAFPADDVTRKVTKLVDALPDHWGTTAGFDLPTSRTEALAALDEFVAERLEWFGPFQDAIVSGDDFGFHARIAAAMNVGLLHPGEIVERAVSWLRDRARAGKGRTGPARDGWQQHLPSVEGFIRQVIGWREYVNGIYWRFMPDYRHRNYFGRTRRLPALYWDPDRTDLACLADAVRGVRDTAYAHHIRRLMVLANFATLAEVDPLALSDWFWAGFADAMEWVELPNVVGMGTYGDGGLLGSKPYVSSAAYLNRMSNCCTGCRYDAGKRTGRDACPFNFLYWTFLDEIRTRKLDVGQRMRLVLKGLERIPAEELAAMHDERRRFLDNLPEEATGWRFDHDAG
ncbi:MAG: cryptochrome/photolyase family protein [Gemmatimonadales bacterium]